MEGQESWTKVQPSSPGLKRPGGGIWRNDRRNIRVVEMRAIQNAIEEILERANLLVIAVAVAIGYATVTLAQAVSGALVMPAISAIFGVTNLEFESFTIRDAEFRYGALLSVVIAFVLVAALSYFAIVVHEGRRWIATTRPCPECTSSIPAAAKRCPRCTAIVPHRPE